MEQLHIEVENKNTGKGRVFQGSLVGYITCGQLWPQSSDNVRPVMLTVACSEAQSRPFVANLLTGRKATTPKSGSSKPSITVECLKSAGYLFSAQRFDGIVVTTAYLPQFFTMDPGMVDPSGIEFILAPPTTWCEEHLTTLPDAGALADHVVKTRKANKKLPAKSAVSRETIASLAPLASLTMAYLDRRTRAPLLQDPRFHLQLLVAMVDTSMALFPADSPRGNSHRDSEWGTATGGWFYVHNAENLKVGPCLVVKTGHARFQELLGEEVRRYYQITKGS